MGMPVSFAMSIQPRVCGDYLRSASASAALADTTPRMRGLLRVASVSMALDRYNPAYAGTTRHAILYEKRTQIQPRVCGDYTAAPPYSSTTSDTTPRMRGLRELSVEEVAGLRYNPAYAGTTLATNDTK